MKACRTTVARAPRTARGSHTSAPARPAAPKPSSSKLSFCKSATSFKSALGSSQKASHSVRSFATKSVSTSYFSNITRAYKPTLYKAFSQKRFFAHQETGQHKDHQQAEAQRITPLVYEKDPVYAERLEEVKDAPLEHDVGAQAAELIYGEKIVGDTSLTGDFGTRDKPVQVPAYRNHRIVGCLGGPGNEHDLLWHVVTKGYKTVCLSCGQFFELAQQEAEHEPTVEVRQTAGVSVDELQEMFLNTPPGQSEEERAGLRGSQVSDVLNDSLSTFSEEAKTDPKKFIQSTDTVQDKLADQVASEVLKDRDEKTEKFK